MMKKAIYFLLVPITIIMAVACGNDKPGLITADEGVIVLDPAQVTKTNSTKLYVHYMPWFETKEVSGAWGMHWTMANKNPDKIDAAGKREIASHFYPLIGPYDSSDKVVLDYHLLLMKYAGIEGVLVDWYGSRSSGGTGVTVATEALLDAVERAGMEIAIVYEDRNNLDGASSVEQMVAWGQEDMRYLEKNFFSKECYAKIDGKPLLMCFGPIALNIGDYADSPARWTKIFSVLNTKPYFMTLFGAAPNAGDENVSSEFTWVDANNSSFYKGLKDKYGEYMASAYPGFLDFYQEGGWGDSYSNLDYRDGDELREQLQATATAEAPIVQLVTWNDFGEGTQIEPTDEDQYKYLEIIQNYSGVTYDVNALKQIYRHYDLRKEYRTDIDAQSKLLQAYYYLISLRIDDAKREMDEIK